jgi:hypothetical protein
VVRITRFVRRSGRARRARRPSEPKLPLGAEAALWSIVEVVPHPRNHLALTRDLSGEVRLTDDERAQINAAFDTYVSEAEGSTAVDVDDTVVDVRDRTIVTVDSYYDLGVINENAPLTDDLFTSAEH